MTNPVSYYVATECGDRLHRGGSYSQRQGGPVPSPTKTKGRGSRGNSSSPKNKPPRNQDSTSDHVEKKVRFGGAISVYYGPPKNSPSGKGSRVSPSRDKSARCSPTRAEYYAGFSDSPSPTALPKPPSHWVSTIRMSSGRSCSANDGSFCPTIIPNLKMVLSAHA